MEKQRAREREAERWTEDVGAEVLQVLAGLLKRCTVKWDADVKIFYYGIFFYSKSLICTREIV